MFNGRPEAKVNLTLEVADRRQDGFHELDSILLRIGLCDRLIVRQAPPDAVSDILTVAGLPEASVEGNLVLRAFDALRAHTGLALPPLEASLEKHIPAAAGLGGGSSDASAALILAQLAWGIALAPEEVAKIGASLGSDVPYFLADQTLAEVGGRGEIVSPLPSQRLRLGLVLVTPPVRLSTRRVFDRHDEMGRRSAGAWTAAEALRELVLDEPMDSNLVAWSRQHPDANDLWPAAVALEPSLAHLRSTLERVSGDAWLMSGSGSTLFALYASEQEAVEAGRELAARRLPELEFALINAVGLMDPDPRWRFP